MTGPRVIRMKQVALRVVEIWWQKRILVESDENDEYLVPKIDAESKSSANFYCIYGQHPVYGNNVLLYIGETKRGGTGKRTIESRLREHFSGRFWDHTDLEITIGLSEQKLTDEEICAVESILIAAHKPALNRKHIDGSTTNSKSFIVHNYGYIRSLASECSGHYWASIT